MSVSFGGKVLPTKIELIRLRRSLKVSQNVHKILEDKRDVLLRRLDEMMDAASRAREEIWEPLLDAYRALYDSYLKLGPQKVEATASATPERIEATVNVKRIVDVDVPTIQITEKEDQLTYGFADTSATLDKATHFMRSILPRIAKAAELENTIYRLANELEKTQRLINALEYIIIPQYQYGIKYIASTLEEREREEFVRLKHVKAIIEKRKETVSVEAD